MYLIHTHLIMIGTFGYGFGLWPKAECFMASATAFASAKIVPLVYICAQPQRSSAKVNVDLLSKCSEISCYTIRNIMLCLFYIVKFNLLLFKAIKPPNMSQRGQKAYWHIWRLLSPRQCKKQGWILQNIIIHRFRG